MYILLYVMQERIHIKIMLSFIFFNLYQISQIWTLFFKLVARALKKNKIKK